MGKINPTSPVERSAGAYPYHDPAAHRQLADSVRLNKPQDESEKKDAAARSMLAKQSAQSVRSTVQSIEGERSKGQGQSNRHMGDVAAPVSSSRPSSQKSLSRLSASPTDSLLRGPTPSPGKFDASEVADNFFSKFQIAAEGDVSSPEATLQCVDEVAEAARAPGGNVLPNVMQCLQNMQVTDPLAAKGQAGSSISFAKGFSTIVAIVAFTSHRGDMNAASKDIEEFKSAYESIASNYPLFDQIVKNLSGGAELNRVKKAYESEKNPVTGKTFPLEEPYLDDFSKGACARFGWSISGDEGPDSPRAKLEVAFQKDYFKRKPSSDVDNLAKFIMSSMLPEAEANTQKFASSIECVKPLAHDLVLVKGALVHSSPLSREETKDVIEKLVQGKSLTAKEQQAVDGTLQQYGTLFQGLNEIASLQNSPLFTQENNDWGPLIGNVIRNTLAIRNEQTDKIPIPMSDPPCPDTIHACTEMKKAFDHLEERDKEGISKLGFYLQQYMQGTLFSDEEKKTFLGIINRFYWSPDYWESKGIHQWMVNTIGWDLNSNASNKPTPQKDMSLRDLFHYAGSGKSTTLFQKATIVGFLEDTFSLTEPDTSDPTKASAPKVNSSVTEAHTAINTLQTQISTTGDAINTMYAHANQQLTKTTSMMSTLLKICNKARSAEVSNLRYS